MEEYSMAHKPHYIPLELPRIILHPQKDLHIQGLHPSLASVCLYSQEQNHYVDLLWRFPNVPISKKVCTLFAHLWFQSKDKYHLSIL